MAEADLVILLGEINYQLAYGSPAILRNEFVRISDIPDELVDNRRGDPEIYANPKIVLDKVNNKKLNFDFDKEWILDIKSYHLSKIAKSKTDVSKY